MLGTGIALAAPALALFLSAAPAAAGGIVPRLSVNIPNVTFQDIRNVTKRSGFATDVNTESEFADIPWLADYITGVYRYAVGVAGLLAGAMFMVGAFTWLTAGGNASRVSQAKERITNSIIGLLLVFGAEVLLLTINPDLVFINTILIERVPRKSFQFQANTTERPTVGARNDPAVVQAILTQAQAEHVDPCALLTICEHESGLTLRIWNGAPRNTVDRAIAFGPCQMLASNFSGWDEASASANRMANAAREKFPDFPALPSPYTREAGTAYRRAIGEWLMTNADGAAWASARMLRAMGGATVGAMAAYGAGGGSISAWQRANSCTPRVITLAAAVAMGFEAAVSAACIPHYPTIGTQPRCGGTNECSAPTVDPTTNEYSGHCANNPSERCSTIDCWDFIRYAIRRYPAHQAQHPAECGGAR